MTERKSFKRRVRTRMEKTGERYTAARRHVADSEPAEETVELASGGRIGDEAVHERTGKTRDEWFAILDRWGGAERPHGDIARYLNAEHGVSGWWAQMVTVEYERARGLRAKHERPDGFSVSATKTVAVPVDRLYAAFMELGDVELDLRTAQPGKTARFDADGGRTRVHAYFSAKGDKKSTVTVQLEKLADAEEAAWKQAAWRDRLARLKDTLETEA